MNKIIVLLFPIFLFAMTPDYWWINDVVYLKKDYPVIYKIKYNQRVYILKFRWTLYKNDGLVMHYVYQNIPYQNVLYKTPQLNGYKKYIANSDFVYSPYFIIYFKDFKNGIAKMQFLIHNPKRDIKISINNPNYRSFSKVKNMPALEQKKFEGEVRAKSL
jgi:hypothetical protein